MGKLPMLMGRGNLYCENGYITEDNLQVQCNPIKITVTFCIGLEKPTLKFI